MRDFQGKVAVVTGAGGKLGLSLSKRFARGVEMPLVWMTVLSPTFLPSFNLMLDIPAVALSLSALEVFFRACARRSWPLTALAGLIAGLAMETKYIAVTVPIAMLIYAVIYRGNRHRPCHAPI